MKHIPKTEIFSLFSFVFGIIGLGLQSWVLSSVDSSGLLAYWHIGEILTLVLLVVLTAVHVTFLKSVKPVGEHTDLFSQSPIAAVGCFLAAAGFILSAATTQVTGILRLLVFGLGILSGLGLGFAGYCRLQKKNPSCLLFAAVAVFLIFHTLASCQRWTAEVQVQTFVFPLLANLFLLLAAYYRSALEANVGNCQHYLFFRYLAIFCCLAGMAGGDWLFYLSGAVWMATDFCNPAFFGKYAVQGG